MTPSPASLPHLTFPNIAIGASAGTGKTFQLSNRYLALLNAGESPERVLAVTFTRKAAGEILERILTRLAQAAASPDNGCELHCHIGGPVLDRGRCIDLLRTLLQNIHRLRVSTLDSFFIQIAGPLVLELGLPVGWQIVEEIDDQRLRAEAMRALLSEDTLEELVSLIRSLSKEEAARTVTGILASIATDLYDLAQQTQSEAWQALPRLPHLSDDVLAGVITQIAAFEFSDKRFTTANDNSVASARGGDWATFVNKGLASAIVTGKETYYNKPIEAPVLEAYQALIEHARALLLGQIADQSEATRRVLDRFGEAYERLKWQRRTLRFDDVTRALPRALTDDRLDDITYRLGAPVTHFLVDEFQDTSLPQWQAIEPFAEAVSQQNGQSFFCVGDVKQAIYGWRGGISELMEAVTSQLPNVNEERLNRSYRSSQLVIDTVNTVFDNLGDNPVFKAFQDATDTWRHRFETHTTVHSNLSGYTCLVTSRLADEGEDQAGVTLEEAAAKVAKLHRQFPSQTIGILVRRNRSVARLIADLRHLHGIAASEEGGNPLTDAVAVQLVLSLLRLGDHPGDTVAGFHVAHSSLGKVVGLEHHGDKSAVLRVSLEVRQSLLSRGYGRTIYGWINALAADCDQNELNRLLQLVDLAYGYDPQATERTMDFVMYVAAKKVENPAAATVRVMTIHQSKGLEFDIVVLPELDVSIEGQPPPVVVDRHHPTEPIRAVCRYVNQDLRRLLPQPFQDMFAAHTTQVVNESLCLLYVAMTRAIRALYLFIAPSKSNEKTVPKTFAGVVRAALFGEAQAMPETRLCEHGLADWQAATSPSASSPANGATLIASQPSPEETEEQKEFTIRLRDSAGRRGRGLERLRPSHSGVNPFINVAEQLRPHMSEAMRRGSLLHVWLEQIEWLDNGEPGEMVLRQADKTFANTRLDMETEIQAFRRMIKMPQTRSLLSRYGYDDLSRLGFSKDCQAELESSNVTLRVLRERPFAMRDHDAIVHGIIDRLILFCRHDRVLAADIIDFKSDALAVGEVAAMRDAIERYRPQLTMYRQAVAHQFRLDSNRIMTRLLFLQLGEICQIEA